MSIFDAIIQGIIQGLTEFLPISSSGHLALYQHLVGQSGAQGLLFAVLLHMGTLLAVIIVYHKTIITLLKEILYLLRDIFTGRFTVKRMDSNRRMLLMMILSSAMLLPLVLPLIPGKDGMSSLVDLFTPVTQGKMIWVVGICFILTACLLLISSRILKRNAPRHKDATAKDAAAVGIAQALAALLPGVSRSGSTVSAGLICGLRKDYVIKYSFVLSIPAILAANVMELKDALEVKEAFSVAPALIGMLVAAVAGVAAIKAIIWLVRNNKYAFFGYYCLAAGVLVIIMSIIEGANGVDSILKLF